MIILPWPAFSENIGSRNLFNYAIRSYVHQRKCLDNFDDRDLEEIIVSKNALKSSQAVKKSEEKAPSEVAMADAANQKLSMVDLETALSYMLRREIPRMKEIQSEAYDALLHWLTVLTKVRHLSPTQDRRCRFVSVLSRPTAGGDFPQRLTIKSNATIKRTHRPTVSRTRGHEHADKLPAK